MMKYNVEGKTQELKLRRKKYSLPASAFSNSVYGKLRELANANKSIFYCNDAILFVIKAATREFLLSSQEGSQITLSLAGMRDLDSPPQGEDKGKDSYEKSEIYRRLADIFSVARSQCQRRKHQ
jgi:hypothetical protein